MPKQPYFKASIFLNPEDNMDSESVYFEIFSGECLEINRDDTPACTKNLEKLPEIKGFNLTFSMASAIELRDFLNFAIPVDGK